MRTLRFLQFFFRRIFMSFPKKRRRAKVDGDESFLAVLRHFKPFGQLDTKIARARAQDEPVLYAHVLPGLDVLLCSVRGAQPPYPAVEELHRRCIECITNALEQPLDGLENGGYWYEANGFGILVFASRARTQILSEFGASASARSRRGARRQDAGDAASRPLRYCSHRWTGFWRRRGVWRVAVGDDAEVLGPGLAVGVNAGVLGSGLAVGVNAGLLGSCVSGRS